MGGDHRICSGCLDAGPMNGASTSNRASDRLSLAVAVGAVAKYLVVVVAKPHRALNQMALWKHSPIHTAVGRNPA